MPSAQGNLVTLAHETDDGAILAGSASDSGKPNVAPFPTEFHDDSDYTQISKSLITATGTGNIHIVTAGKSLYLFSIFLTARNNDNAATASAILEVLNASSVQQWEWRITLLEDQVGQATLSFPIPILIPAGYIIRNNVSSANVVIASHIFGFER